MLYYVLIALYRWTFSAFSVIRVFYCPLNLGLQTIIIYQVSWAHLFISDTANTTIVRVVVLAVVTVRAQVYD